MTEPIEVRVVLVGALEVDLVGPSARMGFEADVICLEYNLTLGQVHAALAYYFENREAIDRSIRESDAMVASLRSKYVSPLQEKLERSGNA